jgi:hypothetical protein
VGSPTYTVNLVDTDGCVVASTTAHTWPGYTLPNGDTTTETVTMPTSESATRVYFLDGDSTVRFLALDGSTGVAAQLPGSATDRVSFSVSPDNTRIAFSVMSWGSTGSFEEQSYVEDVGTGANRTELFTITGGPAEEPIGWVNGDIVYGLLGTFNQYMPGPDPPPFEAYHVANPTNGQRLASICSGSGDAWVFNNAYTSLPTATGVLCRVGDQEDQYMGTLVLVSWSGSHLRTIGDASCANPTAVSPGGIVAIAGQATAVSPSGQCGGGSFTITVNADGTSRTLAATGLVEGWMDDAHLIVDPSTNVGQFPWPTFPGAPLPPLKIVDVVSGSTATVAVHGVFAGSIPSGI